MADEVIGVVDLLKHLKAIENEMQPKLVAQAIRAAMVPTLKQARANAPKGDKPHRTYKGRLVAPGFLKRNIRLKKMKFKDKGRVGYSLGARGEAFYGYQFIERGFTHKGGFKKKTGRATPIKPNPWLGKAEKATEQNLGANFRRELLRRINRYRPSGIRRR